MWNTKVDTYLERLLAAVDSRMLLQMVLELEGFRAFVALELAFDTVTWHSWAVRGWTRAGRERLRHCC